MLFLPQSQEYKQKFTQKWRLCFCAPKPGRNFGDSPFAVHALTSMLSKSECMSAMPSLCHHMNTTRALLLQLHCSSFRLAFLAWSLYYFVKTKYRCHANECEINIPRIISCHLAFKLILIGTDDLSHSGFMFNCEPIFPRCIYD